MNLLRLKDNVLETLRKSGWENGRVYNAEQWINALVSEGYVLNEYAEAVIRELGNIGINYNVKYKDIKYSFECLFDPVYLAEYDRLEDCCTVSGEMLFPVGGMYDCTIYAGSSGTIYAADWRSIAEAGNSIEDFLNNMFDPEYKLDWTYFEKNIVKPNIIKWNVFKKRLHDKFGFDKIDIDKLYMGAKKIIDIGERVHLSDDEGIQYLEKLGLTDSKMYIVNDLCYYRVEGVFLVRNAKRFISDFNAFYGEQFFSGDIVLCDFVNEKIWFYHHSGRFGVI